MTRKLRKRPTADRYGVSTKSIDRWTQDPKLDFPKPIHINTLPYWDLAELEAWERSRARPGRPQTDSTASATPLTRVDVQPSEDALSPDS
jgi:predicted DNA-binding transcriptional regulator AlpA